RGGGQPPRQGNAARRGALRRPRYALRRHHGRFLRAGRGTAGGRGNRALRDLQFRPARLRIAPQSEVLEARALHRLRRRRALLRRPYAPPEPRVHRRLLVRRRPGPRRGPPVRRAFLHRPAPRRRHTPRARGMAPFRSAHSPFPGCRPARNRWRHAPPHQSRRAALQRSFPGVPEPMIGPMIDLRSDTVTKPTPAMRRAMFEAEVGDDVYREVPTGTMGNTIAIKVLTEHGQEVICDSRAHVLDYELAMVAWFSGCVVRAIPTVHGLLSAEEVVRKIRPVSFNAAATGAVAVEQTHNMGGGTVYPMRTLCEIYDAAHQRGVRVHMDGARIFN